MVKIKCNLFPVYIQDKHVNGNRGIAAGLGNIQKLKDGEPLGGRINAADPYRA